MRLVTPLIATLAVLFVTTAASAIEFSIVGTDNASVVAGEQITININLSNPDGIALSGIGASVSEYGANEFVGGQAADNYLNVLCQGGTCFGGLTNLVAGELVESAIQGFDDRVQIALSAGLSSVANTGDVDLGLDGALGTAQFTVTFTAVESAEILIGTSYQGDGVILPDGENVPATGAVFSLVVVPEPGTALLMGLGLAGLATAGRRE